MAREGIENPGKLAAEEASGLVVGVLIIPFIVMFLLLALFFTLGFTDLIFGWGPFGFFEGLFYVGLGILGVGGGLAYMIVKLVRRSARKTVQKTQDILRG